MAEEIVMGISPKLWRGLTAKFVRMSVALCGHTMKIVTLDETDKDLGKTDHYGNVYLNPCHPIIAERSEKEATTLVTGIFGHEMMHQLMSDFKMFKRETKKKPEDEQDAFHMICNIIEDPTIEYFAHQFFGGKLLKALRYTVMQLYREGDCLEKSKSPAQQFFNALIQYGDGGLLKGSFTFPEARKVFYEVIPFVDKAIETYDSEQRVKYMDKVFELSRPIWEPEKEFLKKLRELWKRLGRDHGSSDGFGNGAIQKKLNKGAPQSKAHSRRKITFRRISKEEAEELLKSSPSGGGDMDGDIEVLIPDEPLDIEPQGSGTLAVEGGMPESGEGETGEDNGSSSGQSKENGEEKEGDNAGEAKGKEQEPNADDSSKKNDASMSKPTPSGGPPPDVEDEITEEEYVMSDELLAEITKDIESAKRESELIDAKVNDEENLDVLPQSKKYPGVKCVNYIVKAPGRKSENTYATLVSSIEDAIVSVVNQFKRIFRNDAAEREYRNSGKVNIKRLSSGRMTTRVFEKKKQPGNKCDMAVIMLVDESGSMRGSKTKVARKAAVMLAEVFGRLNIPIKIVGFTEHQNTVQHYHYLTWRNNIQERTKLLNITDRLNNFDGYSIRYCSELLNKRPEEHKLMIVISDGWPAATYYTEHNEGIVDVRNAVQQASKQAQVLGILIGDEEPESHLFMYGKNFLHITDIQALPNLLAQKVKRMVKEW